MLRRGSNGTGVGCVWARVDSSGFSWILVGRSRVLVMGRAGKKESSRERSSSIKQVAARPDQARKGKARLGKATNPGRILGKPNKPNKPPKTSSTRLGPGSGGGGGSGGSGEGPAD
ncbi:hypothetical protein V498_08629 [Pseudogymnoascus sp. VKM F-4517 (FW-2822)]|nr:hypothetical protein V498_08629 [Pseudogymnoascus sp. VKM F-4517 (FW-2822)]